MKIFLVAFVLLFVFLPGQATPQQDEGKQINVKFAKGKTSAIYKDSVVRGTTNTYYFRAKAGQKLAVTLTPFNAKNKPGFDIYSVQSKTVLPQTSESSLRATLPNDGEYMINVSPGFGNTGYKLHIEVR